MSTSVQIREAKRRIAMLRGTIRAMLTRYPSTLTEPQHVKIRQLRDRVAEEERVLLELAGRP